MKPTPFRAALSAAYLEVDPRSLGAFRILFGATLLGDLIRHIPAIPTWFARDGVVPPSVEVALDRGHVPLSIFLVFPTTPVFVIAFAFFGLVYASYLVGYRTRLCQVLAVVALVSLHGRVSIIEHAGERSLHIFAILTAFLPLGARYSVDALRARRPGVAPSTRPVRSIAMLAMLLQLAAIYVLDWAIKTDGAAWQNGSAIIGAIQPMTGTALGFFVRDHAPILVLQGLSVGTLLFEFCIWPLLLLPLPRLRVAAALGMIALHLGIRSLLNLGVFQPAMIAPALLLFTPGVWRWLERAPRLASLRAALARLREPLLRVVPASTDDPKEPSRPLTIAREVGAALILAGLALTVCSDNDLVPAPLHTELAVHLRPVFMRVGVFEHWEHYTNPELYDGLLTVDAITRDGRHVDPVNLDAFGYDGPPLVQVPRRADLTLLWWNYEKSFAEQKQILLPALAAWIERFPARTGRPDDEIASYEIRWVQTGRDLRGRPLASRIAVFATCDRDHPCR